MHLIRTTVRLSLVDTSEITTQRQVFNFYGMFILDIFRL